LALAACGMTKGDEVIIPAFTMIATANAVTYTGAKVVLVDAEPRTYNIDAERIEKKITLRTKAIIVVHIYGHPANMDKILGIAKKYKLYVIEDAAEAHGAEYKGKKVGGIGDVGCFSFYGNKIITTGEGGMVITNNRKIAQRATYLRDHTFSKERHFWHKELGFNYRMTNLQAAIGLAQTENIKEFVERKIKIAKLYNSLLKDINGITLAPHTPGIKNVYWAYSILIEKGFGINRDRLRCSLANRGIETRAFFIPMHLQPVYSKVCKGHFPVAEEICRKGLYLPSGLKLKKDEIRFIVDSIKKAKG
jgi:perosamine synthetase